jgi:hypothetical protein
MVTELLEDIGRTEIGLEVPLGFLVVAFAFMAAVLGVIALPRFITESDCIGLRSIDFRSGTCWLLKVGIGGAGVGDAGGESSQAVLAYVVALKRDILGCSW